MNASKDVSANPVLLSRTRRLNSAKDLRRDDTRGLRLAMIADDAIKKLANLTDQRAFSERFCSNKPTSCCRSTWPHEDKPKFQNAGDTKCVSWYGFPVRNCQSCVDQFEIGCHADDSPTPPTQMCLVESRGVGHDVVIGIY